ncbi:oligosaccharide flippase family protein [Methanothermococcus sp. SCGC AD-155-C09]|nr:oligosaccharide flippase family protein [Methanothermococcus sp. SCGC AD-155-C09]
MINKFKEFYYNLKERIYLIAKKYSSKVGLDLPYFIKGGFWLSFGQFFSILRGFILSVILANMLSKESFGEYSFVLSILILAGIFALPGMNFAIIQSVAKGYEGTYFRALMEVFKYSWIGSFILVGASVYMYFKGNFNLSTIFLTLSVMFPFYSISPYYQSFLNGKKRFDLLSKLSSFFNVLLTLFVVAVVFITKSVFWIVVSIVLIQILICGYFSVFYIRRFIKNSEIDESSIDFGKGISPSLALTGFANNFDSLIMVHFLGFSELAIFKIVTVIPDQIKIFMDSLAPLILPKMVSKDVSKKEIMGHFKKFLLLVILLIVIYWIIAPFIFKWFYPKYYDYVWLSMIFHLSFISFLSILPLNYLLKEKEKKFVSKYYNYSSIFLVIASFVFIYYMGLIGAIVARMLYRLFLIFLVLYYFLKSE